MYLGKFEIISKVVYGVNQIIVWIHVKKYIVILSLNLTCEADAARAGEQRRYRDHLEDVARITKLMLILSGS